MIAEDATISRLVGSDAEGFASGRAKMGDSGWLSYGDRQSDEDWWERFNADFPF